MVSLVFLGNHFNSKHVETDIYIYGICDSVSDRIHGFF